MFDYENLKLIWWVLVGVLLIGFALTDGFDLGAAVLMPFVGRNDNERRVVINTIAPHWDGNQVWLITAGGALFAAWPLVYAAAFSGLYWALLLVLFALFVRPVGFDYRSKLANTRWRACSWAAWYRRWCSASPSATCCWACRSASTTPCVPATTARSGNCSAPSACSPAWSA